MRPFNWVEQKHYELGCRYSEAMNPYQFWPLWLRRLYVLTAPLAVVLHALYIAALVVSLVLAYIAIELVDLWEE